MRIGHLGGKRRILLIISIVSILVISSFSIYVTLEKEVWIKIYPYGLVNNTIDVFVNSKICVHEFIDNSTFAKRPIGIGGYTKTSGILITVKVIGVPINNSLEKSFNLLFGCYFSISYYNGEFSISQSIGHIPDE